MKKISNLIVSLGALLALTSCDLNLEPHTGPKADDLKTFSLEYCEGMRDYIYVDMKALLSGDFFIQTDLYADIYTPTILTGNGGVYVYNQRLYTNDSTVSGFWSSYYGAIKDINYAKEHLEKALESGMLSANEISLVKGYIAEMHFFRAYVMYRLSLMFCEDYDPARATEQLGVPYPVQWDPEAKLPRKTLADVYTQLEKDLVEAEKEINSSNANYKGGAAGSYYVTENALKAFRAQYALQIHDYQTASTLAKELYSSYPLVQSKDELERMWYLSDKASEDILVLNTIRTTSTSTNSFADLIQASWDAASSQYLCGPYYVPEQHVVDLFSAEDYRTGIYISQLDDPEFPYTINVQGYTFQGIMIKKFMGDKTFQTSDTQLGYRIAPKMFRIADMYLIDAEAQWRLGGDAATPLNDVRQSRGLAALDAAANIETELMNERLREMVAEGTRLYDLKRWDDPLIRDIQSSLSPLFYGTWMNTIPADQASRPSQLATRYAWPIPYTETVQNPNIGPQNPGYTN